MSTAVSIRSATASDASRWLSLVEACLGSDSPERQLYDVAWIASQLDSASGHQTWVAEGSDGVLYASLTVLSSLPTNANPVGNLARNLFHPESFDSGAAVALLAHLNAWAQEQGQLLVARVLASQNREAILFESQGYVCAGFQPFKHMYRVREGTFFYLRFSRPEAITRAALSESLSQVNELATFVLKSLDYPVPSSVRDGATGYPSGLELQIHDATYEDYELWRIQAEPSHPPIEVSSGFNIGQGFFRVDVPQTLRALLGQRENQVVAGLAYLFDERDRCVRIVETFVTDDLSLGSLFQQVVKLAEEQFNAVYVEVDILMTAPRLLKCVEQLGFVPIAYLPAFYFCNGRHADVVKLVKLNVVYSLENEVQTSSARAVTQIIDHNFQDQKVGVAIINLLRGLPIFGGLGDGELRKIARLFTQKLYRAQERIFNIGDSGNEAYVVMRGQIDIFLKDRSEPIASVGNGQIFGEIAFLDGASRAAMAVASQASILLVIQRSAFNNLVQREPHLGMVIMRNIALELSNRLRRTNLVVSPR